MADGGVRVLSTGLVHAAVADQQQGDDTKLERIPLTPCDLRLFLLGTIQKGLLFRKPPFPIHQTLKSSFSAALAAFYPLAGRLSVDHHPGGTASVYIDCNNAGALFVHAAADGVSVADLLEPLYVPPILRSFFPLNSVRNHHGVSEPLVAVQITELVDGIFVGCTMNHSVVDGTTFWRFMNLWSQICRSSGGGGGVCFTRHWFLDEKHRPIRFPWTMVKDNLKQDNSVPPPPPLTERVFHFSREKIAALKSHANETINRNNISSLQSLVSHIWRAAIRNRADPDPDRESRFLVLVGFRSRWLEPEFPNDYLGNATGGCMVVLRERDLVEKGLGHVAAEVNRVVTEQATEEKLKEGLEGWIEKPVFPRSGAFVEGSMVLGSSPRYDVYGNDFGFGKPVAVRSGGANKVNGKVTVFPGVEAGSMDVEICLSPEMADRLGRDPEFMAAVGV